MKTPFKLKSGNNPDIGALSGASPLHSEELYVEPTGPVTRDVKIDYAVERIKRKINERKEKGKKKEAQIQAVKDTSKITNETLKKNIKTKKEASQTLVEGKRKEDMPGYVHKIPPTINIKRRPGFGLDR